MSWYSRCALVGAASLACAALLFCPVFGYSEPQNQVSHQAATPAAAHIAEVLRSLNRGRFLGQVAISPDGKRLAWIEGSHGEAEILTAPLNRLSESRPVTAAQERGEPCEEGQIAWSPDSQALAFLSDCADPGGQEDLYLSRLDGTPARRLTELNGYVHDPAFSPGGTRVAFLYVEGVKRPAGALAAQRPPSGVIGKTDLEVQRVAAVGVNAAQPQPPTFLTPAYLHVYEFDWSPDSKSLAYIAARPPGENNWWIAKLYTQRVVNPPEPAGEDGACSAWAQGDCFSPHAILDPSAISGPLHGLQIAVPRWSPDGKEIAFIGGLMSDQGVTGGDVWIVPAGGGRPHDLTPQRRSTPAWITWDGNRHLYVDEIAGGDCRLFRLALGGNPAGPDVSATPGGTVFSFPGAVGDGRLELSLSSTAGRSLFVFTASTLDRPPEIYAARPGAKITAGAAGASAGLIQLTHINRGVVPAWGKSVSVSWKNEGFNVQGWLTLPKGYNPSHQYPLIVEVHGGPAAAVIPYWGAGGSLSPSAFSALGYFVLQPNPRGSYGQGEAFTQANRKDFGYGDLRDILAGVDAVEAKYPIDPRRVGLTGWSYGGFMTMFAVTQTQRFKAAVAGAGISDWLSYYGENSIDQWMIPYFGAPVYDDPAIYAKSSAINFIKRAHTPTLVVVGSRDGECPAPQSFEFWHALRDLHVPTELVVYAHEGHGFVSAADNRDVLERAAEWFAHYMP